MWEFCFGPGNSLSLQKQLLSPHKDCQEYNEQSLKSIYVQDI